MHLDTTPVIDRLIADRRRFVGYESQNLVQQLQERINRLEQALRDADFE